MKIGRYRVLVTATCDVCGCTGHAHDPEDEGCDSLSVLCDCECADGTFLVIGFDVGQREREPIATVPGRRRRKIERVRMAGTETSLVLVDGVVSELQVHDGGGICTPPSRELTGSGASAKDVGGDADADQVQGPEVVPPRP